jgi:hypothetical protein
MLLKDDPISQWNTPPRFAHTEPSVTAGQQFLTVPPGPQSLTARATPRRRAIVACGFTDRRK